MERDSARVANRASSRGPVGKGAIVIAALSAVVLVTVPAAVGSSSRATGAPIFYMIPPDVDHLQPFTVGENVTSRHYSYCWPTPKPGRFCGGALNKGTVIPSGGTPGESYDFFEKGFLPPGLHIAFNSGLLVGTVRPQLNRTWKFQVCAYQPLGGGKSRARCAPTSLTVIGAYDGHWQGALTGTFTYVTPNENDTVPIDDNLSGGVANGKMITDGLGQILTDPPTPIGANGNATITYTLSGDLTCTFPIQFHTDGTASSGQTLSCQSTYSQTNGNYVSTFTGGSIQLKRDSLDPRG